MIHYSNYQLFKSIQILPKLEVSSLSYVELEWGGGGGGDGDKTGREGDTSLTTGHYEQPGPTIDP